MRLKFTLLAICFAAISSIYAQSIDNAGAYMDAITNAKMEMSAKYMTYLSAAAHGRRAKKVEKLRTQTVESITNSRFKISDLPYFKGDNSLRQANMDYMQILYYVFNDDYAKIVNMEDIAEQSFDEMQAYILLKEKTGEKLQEAFNRVSDSTKSFAKRYNVTMIEGNSELGEKMEVAGKLNHYNNDIFLVFFKCNWQDGVLAKAISNKKVNDAEQARNSLIRYADEGLATLKADSMKSFEGDASLAAACREVLNFYKSMAQNDVPKLTDLFLKEENFDKIKKAFEAKAQNARTQADVDAYNKTVNDMNAAIGIYNQTNNDINKKRTDILNSWEKADKKFSDEHMPHYK